MLVHQRVSSSAAWLHKTNQYKSCKEIPKISSLPVQHLDEIGRDQLMKLGSRWYTPYQIDRHYPLVNVCITMENHNLLMGKSTISMAMFNSYVSLPEGISH